MNQPEVTIDETDRAILNRIQSDFPITSRPYRTISEELGLPENEVLKRILRLKESGIIRRIGGNFKPEKLGFVSTLCAAKVPENKIPIFTEVVNRYPGVIAPSMDEINANLKQIADETGINEILNLPATKVFKIKAEFKV
jgi:DNA-binding Lrp family transcriptional regulator